jgi:hypothetical protein
MPNVPDVSNHGRNEGIEGVNVDREIQRLESLINETLNGQIYLEIEYPRIEIVRDEEGEVVNYMVNEDETIHSFLRRFRTSRSYSHEEETSIEEECMAYVLESGNSVDPLEIWDENCTFYKVSDRSKYVKKRKRLSACSVLSVGR